MTPKKINGKIARKLGYQKCHPWDSLITPTGRRQSFCPDFINDLNECARMEATLNFADQERYGRTLAEICIGKEWSEPDFNPNGWGWFSAINATPKQKCEAILRVWGLWED